ncbi:MAG: polyphosphate polymerase domain-containing protein [Dysgonamonadaceae bacterium]|jgi:hypothetical protein|nr:polyphosphate polymerase domain-containing protein [Dysgonamonadaceae bacterium]
MMNASIDHLLAQMQPISLSEMQDIHLMDRVDSKFIAPVALFPELLENAIPYYKVQENEGKRIASYETQYLDTPALDFFNMHQTGKPNRQKIRIRTYIDSNLSFLEIKNRNDRGRTRKIRVPVGISHIQTIDDLHVHLPFLEKHSIFDSRQLEPALGVTFHRITLVNHRVTERVTLDLNLSFVNYRTGNTNTAGPLLVLELKQDGWQPSDFHAILNRFNLQEVAFSKYCMGTTLTMIL